MEPRPSREKKADFQDHCPRHVRFAISWGGKDLTPSRKAEKPLPEVSDQRLDRTRRRKRTIADRE